MESLAVVFIRNDRRLIDHEGLQLTKEFDRFLILVTLPVQWEMPERISEKRKTFILSGINYFAKSLGTLPVHFAADTEKVIEELKLRFDVTVLAEEQGASEEEAELASLGAKVIKTRANTLFAKKKLFPTFTPFRNAVQNEEILPSEIVQLNEKKAVVIDEFLFKPFSVPEYQSPKNRMDYYLKNHLIEYPDTRNYLESENGSSKFSYFLAGGELSVRDLYSTINSMRPGNWLGVELLWREFFWQHGADFSLRSTGKTISNWESEIHHPLARAIYNELVTTGYISNRSRQILASYLIYELGLDWKIGAAFYEKHLLDYDVFVNWGNWQYIAGVKFDPRGGRKFNLDLQVEKYDPSGEYRKKWANLL
jgi:deoxyribodipyrimidine photo-lyase